MSVAFRVRLKVFCAGVERSRVKSRAAEARVTMAATEMVAIAVLETVTIWVRATLEMVVATAMLTMQVVSKRPETLAVETAG